MRTIIGDQTLARLAPGKGHLTDATIEAPDTLVCSRLHTPHGVMGVTDSECRGSAASRAPRELPLVPLEPDGRQEHLPLRDDRHICGIVLLQLLAHSAECIRVVGVLTALPPAVRRQAPQQERRAERGAGEIVGEHQTTPHHAAEVFVLEQLAHRRGSRCHAGNHSEGDRTPTTHGDAQRLLEYAHDDSAPHHSRDVQRLLDIPRTVLAWLLPLVY